jgi:hypothetical protein
MGRKPYTFKYATEAEQRKAIDAMEPIIDHHLKIDSDKFNGPASDRPDKDDQRLMANSPRGRYKSVIDLAHHDRMQRLKRENPTLNFRLITQHHGKLTPGYTDKQIIDLAKMFTSLSNTPRKRAIKLADGTEAVIDDDKFLVEDIELEGGDALSGGGPVSRENKQAQEDIQRALGPGTKRYKDHAAEVRAKLLAEAKRQGKLK